MPKFHVRREITIDAPCDEVFSKVSDLGTWTTWSPWLIADPAATVEVSDPSDAVGSTYHWSGDASGEGRLEHQVLDAPTRIQAVIQFLKPMRSVSEVSFDLEPVGERTRIGWNMDGSLPWFLFWMTGMMDGFIGGDYERGLKMLKDWIETGRIDSRLNIHGSVSCPELRIAGLRRECPQTDIGPVMRDVLCTVADKLKAAGLSSQGPAASVYHRMDMKRKVAQFTSGLAIPANADVPDGLVEWSAPTGRGFRVEHVGAYEHLGNGWSAAFQHVRHKRLKLQKRAAPFEVYQNSPEETPSAALLTDIYLPLRN